MIFEENRETLSKIATLFYIGELSLSEIADMFNISRFKVARILKKCREYGIIEFHINNKPIYYRNMEIQICELLGLEQSIIAPSGVTVSESKKNVGRAAAKYLEENLKDGMTVGCDWGSTIQEMVREFSPKKQYKNCLFVQTSGSVISRYFTGKGYEYGHDIVKTLAVKVGASYSLFPAPYIVKDKLLCSLLMLEPAIRKNRDLFQKIDIAFIGIGSSNFQNYDLVYKNFLSLEELEALRKYKYSGELLGNPITMDGQATESSLTGRVLSISLDEIKQIPNVVVIGSGADKSISLIAASRGGFFNRIFIDEMAALNIINYFDADIKKPATYL